MTADQPVLEGLCWEGPRLRLRPVRADDAPAAFPLIHGERRVLDWLCWQGPDDEVDLASAYSTWRSVTPNGTDYHLALDALDQEGEPFIGTAALRFQDHPFIADLGYWLGVPHHGRGYGTELVALLARLAFGPLASNAVTAEVFPGNRASERVLERNGFRLERDVTGEALGDCGLDPDRPRRLFLALRSDLPDDSARPERRAEAPLAAH